MQFLLLLVVNIFMGAVLYLIISLKLEKSASEFREKKLRKEMDDIIKEFNATADRNITILENRIAIMKRLLENSGDFKSIDISVDEGVSSENPSIEGKDTYPQFQESKSLVSKELPVSNNQESTKEIDFKSKKENSLLSKNVLTQLRNKVSIVIDKFSSSAIPKNDYYAELNESLDPIIKDNIRNDPVEVNPSFEDETFALTDIEIKTVNGIKKPVSIAKELSEDEIPSIISNSSDKYSAISELYEKGFTIETISRYSGIPAGEVKLVLNLHGSGM